MSDKPTMGVVTFGPGMGTKSDITIEVSTKEAQRVLRETKAIVEAVAKRSPSDGAYICEWCDRPIPEIRDPEEHAEDCPWVLANKIMGFKL